MVSIRTPRAGRDQTNSSTTSAPRQFLSARPGRGATNLTSQLLANVLMFLSARPGRGATFLSIAVELFAMVSIRTPRAGRDLYIDGLTLEVLTVSIRTPRAGRDKTPPSVPLVGYGFYPHAPGGARHARYGGHLG